MKAKKKVPPTKRRAVYPREGMASIEDAVEFLQIGRSKIYEMIKEGVVSTVDLCGVKRLPWPTLHELARSPQA